jgi:hypothetical protein
LERACEWDKETGNCGKHVGNVHLTEREVNGEDNIKMDVREVDCEDGR